VIGGDLEDLRGIAQPVDFVQDDATTAETAEKGLRIGELPADAGQFAVDAG
jgi:hypothetical protein